MAKAKLTVTTPVGTFTRQTARTYTHVVIVDGVRSELLEANRLASIESLKRDIVKYERAIADNGAADLAEERARVLRNGMTPERADEWVASIAYIHAADEQSKYRASAVARLAELEARGPIVEDEVKVGDLGWCGRLDLARKLATSTQANRYRTVRIFEVATGKEVR